LGWSVTTSRPIPGKAPKKATRKEATLGSTSGKHVEPPSKRMRASKVHKQATQNLQFSETSSERKVAESSVDPDDTSMREIDETALASTEGDEGSSSPPVTILPNDPHVGASYHIPNPRSPPPSFEDFIEEEVIATLAEGVRGSAVSPARPAIHRESSVPKRKGKEVSPDIDEGPTPKKLHAARDSEFMVNRILAMAKIYAPPRSASLPAADLSPRLLEPLHSPSLPVISLEPGPIHVTDRTEERKALPRQLPTSSLQGEEQDNFSLEFTRLQEEVAFNREALERASPTSLLPTGSGSLTPTTACTVPETSTSSPPNLPPQARPRSNFQTERLIGCPLEALNSLVTSEYLPEFGHLPVENYAEQLTGRILQVRSSMNLSWVAFHHPCNSILCSH
jgi:hypothetical protein